MAPDVDVTEALKPFGSSRMLPAAAYTSAQVFAWEQRELFAGSWTCLGRAAELFAGTTSQRGFTAGGVPGLVTRDGDALRAFPGTRPHRRGEPLRASRRNARRRP